MPLKAEGVTNLGKFQPGLCCVGLCFTFNHL